MAKFTYLVTSIFILVRSFPVNSEDYRISLMYPLSAGNLRYFGAFYNAVEYINEESVKNNWNITLIPSLDDIDRITSPDGTNSQPGDEIESIKEEESLRIIYRRHDEGYDALIGPALASCKYQARLATALNMPLIGYVSFSVSAFLPNINVRSKRFL